MAISRLRGVELPWDSQPQDLTDLSAALGLVSTAVVAGPLRSVGAYQATNTGAANVASTGFEAIRLTGSTGRMQAPARAGTTPWTLLAYGIWRASSASSVMTLAEAPGSATYDRSLHISSTGLVCGYVFDGAVKESQSAATLSVGVPALIAVVCTGSTMTSYIDGIAGTPTAVSNAGFNSYATPELVFGYGGGLGGGGTNGSATLASSFDAAYAIKLDWAATEALLRELAARPWEAFEQRRIWVPMVSAGGASAALTGASAAAAAGTLAPSISVALSGAAASVAAGSVAAGSDVTTALTGVSSTTAAGTLTAATSTSVALTGVSSTTAAGTLAASISVALAGISSTAAAGTLSAGGDASAAVTGQAASTAQGTVGVTVSGAAALSGASVAASAGTVAVGISTALTGASAAASAGSLTAANSDVSVTISGQAVSTAQGTISAAASGSVSVALSGAAAVIAAGDIFVIAPSVGWTPVDDSVPNLWVPVDDSNAASWA